MVSSLVVLRSTRVGKPSLVSTMRGNMPAVADMEVFVREVLPVIA
jgi:hypothetical protein